MASYTANWRELGNLFFRHQELDSMRWYSLLDLKNCAICVSPFSGPIAVIRKNATTLTLNHIQPQDRPLIEIFNACGHKLNEIRWNAKHGRLIYFAWTHDEQLLCIAENGEAYIYNLHGVLQKMLRFPIKVRVVDVRTCTRQKDTFIVLADESDSLYGMQDLAKGTILEFALVPRHVDFRNQQSCCWDIYCSTKLSVLLYAGTEFYIISSRSVDEPAQCAPIRCIFEKTFSRIDCLAFDHMFEHVAFFTDAGFINIGLINDTSITGITEFNTKSKIAPTQLVWAGQNAIGAHWDKLPGILFIGFEKNFFYFNEEEKKKVYFALISELDGMRIVGNDSHVFVEQIPNVVIRVFRIGSQAPGAELFAAYREFQKKSHRANEYIQILKNQEVQELAVRECIQAAGYEFKPSVQKLLLRAAAYGKSYIQDENVTQLFMRICINLRVLNAIRRTDVALPLSYEQFERLRTDAIIDKLIVRHCFIQAIKICDYLKVDRKNGVIRIIKHWAHYKVRQFEYSDALVAEHIARKISNNYEVSFAEIASQALEYNRKELAIQLLNLDYKSSDQVPLLLKLQLREDALVKAIESGDPNLIYSVILSPAFRQNTSVNFYKLIKRFPIAYQLYLSYLKECDSTTLKEFLHLDGNQYDRALHYIREAHAKNANEPSELRHILLDSALEAFQKGKHEFAIAATEEQIKLLKYQQKLEDKFRPQKYVGLSLQDTIKHLITNKLFKPADELRKEYRVPDKRYWWLKLDTLAKQGEWLELEKFANHKKSPIGYEPFVDICLNHRNVYEAHKYVSKVKDENKINYYVKAGLMEEAIRIACDKSSTEGLDYIRSQLGVQNAGLEEKIDAAKQLLNGR